MTVRTLSKEKIILAAIKIINTQETLTFTKLSRLLGTRAQAIYNYYPDVTALKVAIADHFYDRLTQRLQADLMGLSGKEALKPFAHVSVQFSLSHFLVTQQILSIPTKKTHDKDLDSRFLVVDHILNDLLEPLIKDSKYQLIISRMLKNLIVGEIIHVGNDRFSNQKILSRDSFDKMLDITLFSL
ncbi:TetR/AcrR family transcriptional regulator [Companilactobacillus alimentarius]